MGINIYPGVVFWKGDNRFIVYKNTTQEKFYINKLCYKILKKCNGKNKLEDLTTIFQHLRNKTIYNIIKQLSEKKILSSDLDKRKKEITSLKDINVYYLSLTNDCNLKCKYCLKENQSNFNILKKEKWKKMIDVLNDSNSNKKTIYFTGGEPTLFNGFIDIYSYAYKKGFKINIFSNGTTFNSNLYNCFKEYPPNALLFSIDGSSKDINDFLRGCKGAYSKIIKSTKKYNKLDANII